MTGCQFGLCRREAEFEVVVLEAPSDPMKVCGLHVTPIVTWGVPDPGEPELRYLRTTAA